MIEIGNIDSTPNDKLFFIYDGVTLQPKTCVSMPDDTVVHAELMGTHYLQFSFNYYEIIDFGRTDYVWYDGIKYTLRADYQPREVNVQHYNYELKFEAPEMLFLDFPNFYRLQDLEESEWTLTGKAEQFLHIAVMNINAYFGGDEYSVGVVEPTEILNIHFDGVNVFDSLTTIAETFNAEWYLDHKTKTINLVAHHEVNNIVTLQREVSLVDIEPTNDNREEYCTRLYAFGSTRNIPTNYRKVHGGEMVDAIVQKKLRLPIEVGDFIDAYPEMGRFDVVSKIKVFEDIYPKRIGTITSLRSKEDKDDEGNPFIVYYFQDAGLSFKNKYIIPGLELRLSFGENSWLSGRDFEVIYNDKNKEFKIIPDNSTEIPVPNDIIKPKLGDYFTLYNFDISLVGDQYVGEAEKELEKAAREYLESVIEDHYTYVCNVDPVYRYNNDLDLPIGQRVRLKSNLLDAGEKLSRVFAFEKNLATYQDTYTVGDKPTYYRLLEMDKTIWENKKITDLQYLEAMKIANFAYKNSKALNYLRVALENETSIEGGLILTSLIRLGMMVGDTWQEKAGVSGVLEKDDVFLWGGGTLDEAVEGNTPIGLRADGSGWLANQNILWDAMGDLLLQGKFESNNNGNRIVIDPEDRSIKMVSDKGHEVMNIFFEKDEEGTWISPKINLNQYTDNEISVSTSITGYEVRIENNIGNVAYLQPDNIGFFNNKNSNAPSFSVSVDDGGEVLQADFIGLPTSKANVVNPTGLYMALIDGHTVICKK